MFSIALVLSFLMGAMRPASEILVSLLLVMLPLSTCLNFEIFQIDSVWTIWDPLGSLMTILTFWVVGLVIIMSLISKKEIWLILTLFCYILAFFFSSTKFIGLFIFYELSLLPMFSLVMGWGNQPERIPATFYMVFYTIGGSVPLLISILKLMSTDSSMLYFLLMKKSLSDLIMVGLTLAFLVKVPVYLLHSWLPKAHVEAPLEGSVLLASVMLKMGVFGLLRMMYTFLSYGGTWMIIIFSVSLVGGILASLLVISSPDMKMSVAFVSVSHMNLMLAGLMAMKLFSLKAITFICVSHGFTSSALFVLVTWAYSISNSRSWLMNSSVGRCLKLAYYLQLLGWAMNMAVPPTVSFLGEVSCVTSVLSFCSCAVFGLSLYFMFSSFYSMLFFGYITHGNYKSPFKVTTSSWLELLVVLMTLFPNFYLFFFMEL